MIVLEEASSKVELGWFSNKTPNLDATESLVQRTLSQILNPNSGFEDSSLVQELDKDWSKGSSVRYVAVQSLGCPEPTTNPMVRLKEAFALAKMIFNHFYIIYRAHSATLREWKLSPIFCAQCCVNSARKSRLPICKKFAIQTLGATLHIYVWFAITQISRN
jgi:hypothetical protein